MNEIHWRLLAHVTAPMCRRLAITYYAAVVVIVGNVVMNQWIRNGTAVTGRKPPYSCKRLINVYKSHVHVYEITR